MPADPTPMCPKHNRPGFYGHFTSTIGCDQCVEEYQRPVADPDTATTARERLLARVGEDADLWRMAFKEGRAAERQRNQALIRDQATGWCDRAIAATTVHDGELCDAVRRELDRCADLLNGDDDE